MNSEWWLQTEQDFTQTHTPLEATAFTDSVDFIEGRLGRELTMDEFRMVQFFYTVGHRRGCEAMAAIHRTY